MLLQKIPKEFYHFASSNEIYESDSLYYYTLIQKGFYNKYGQKDSLWTENFGIGFYRKGSYRNDQKVGTWLEYEDNEKNVCGTGCYSNNYKSGIWEYYNSCDWGAKKKLYCQYDYESDSLLYQADCDNRLSFRTLDKKISSMEPIYPYGGFNCFNRLFRRINLNKLPMDIDFFHTIIYQIKVEADGTVTYIVLKASNDLNDAVKNLYNDFFKTIPKEWLCPKPRKTQITIQSTKFHFS